MTKLRVLLIEDDVNRYQRLLSWMPADVKLVWAKDAGAAIGVLERLQPGDYAGLMLDFDLDKQHRTVTSGHFNGGHVVDVLLSFKDRDVPILVHSNNVNNGPKMALRLSGAGYDVTKIRMADLTQERFLEWVGEIREEFEAR